MDRSYTLTAQVYDLVHTASGKNFAVEAREVHEQIQTRCPGAASLLDVACGTGAHLVHLNQWYDVVGVDLEPSMLAVAEGRLPDVELVEGDMRSFDLGRRFDAVVCLFSSIGYMASVADLHRATAALAGHVADGGVLVIDGWLRTDAWIDPGLVDAVVGREGEMAVSRVGTSRRDGQRTQLEMHYLIGTLDAIEHVVEHHDLTLFSDSEYRGALEAAGLEVEVVPSPMPGRDRYISARPPRA